MKRIYVLLSLSLIVAPRAQAGDSTPVTIPVHGERAAQYYVGEENELLMRVNVWGRVDKPGQYYVPSDTDLITLISLAGGPADKSRLNNVRLVRAGNSHAEVFEVNIKKFLKTGNRQLIPDLQPEDTIIVSGSMWYLFSSIVQVVSQLAIVANVYYLASLANK